METLVLKPDEQALERAAALLRAGELVGMPTETVYGLAADGLNGQAALKIFEAKQRPADNPLIEHIAHMDQIGELIRGELPEQARKLAQAFWPGPLTMILPKSEKVPKEVSAGLDTVAVRMPSHPIARALIEKTGRPLAAPSANRSGRPSPTRASHVLEDMQGRIPLILDGGSCEVGLESTVVEFVQGMVRVLRPGGVTPEMIEAVLGGVWVDESVLKPLAPGQVVRSPGMKYRHYAPQGNLTIIKGAPERVANRIAGLYDQAIEDGASAAILCMKQNETRYGSRRVHALGQSEGLESVASDLFDALRLMDEEKVERIFAEAVDIHGLGLAIMNRMGRAAAFHVVDADKGE